MIKFARLLSISFLFAICSVIITGCESNSSGGGGSDGSHDFGENDPNLYVAYGDSITYGVGLASASRYPQQLSGMLGKTVINAGSSGRWASDGVSGISSTLSRHKPGYILILFGANDLVFGRNTDAIVSNLRTIVQVSKNNNTIPIIGTLTPVYDSHSYMTGGIDELNPKIKQMAKEEGIRVANLSGAFGSDRGLMQSDGLHPTAAGAAKMAQVFGSILR